MTDETLTPYEREQRIAELKRHLDTLPPHHASGTRQRLEQQIADLQTKRGTD
ncbi:MAG: hypothetical protein WD360_06640 [Nitriliruptoraceae bacterium]